MHKLLYTPSEETISKAQITEFTSFFAKKISRKLSSYLDLHNSSIDSKEEFWQSLVEYFDIKGDFSGQVIENGSHIKNDKYFPEAKLNYAENLLKPFEDNNHEIMVFSSEGQNKKRFTAGEVKSQISSLVSFFKSKNIQKGDRIAAVMPNMPETVTSMIAATSMGGVWASCSPDFGADSIVDRFSQISPKIIIIVDKYRYNGKIIDLSDKINELKAKLPDIENFIIVPFDDNLSEELLSDNKIANYSDIIKSSDNSKEIEFVPLDFSDPLFILFSSGTTGVPKCIVHCVGGTLLQHIKEHRLHCDIKSGDRFFYYTTCGWMMWNWLVSGLASGATLLLYDGSPFAPEHNVIFEYLESEKATFFGTSAKYIDSLRKTDLSPKEHYKLKDLRTISSTGSALSDEGFEFVYQHIKSDVHLASISGGTDIVSCFVLGSPNLPVYSGEIQAKGLGMDVVILDENGNEISKGKGELACKSSFPSMPIGFWNDPDGKKYHDAYYSNFENIWSHGDFAEVTDNNGVVIYGRSDTVLNPGGVRIGTAEIYRQVEKCDDVLESVCIGQKYEDDIRVVLFLKLREGKILGDDLVKQIKTEIRKGTSPRHVPAIIKSVPDIPRTKSGKITEIAVRDIIHGKEIANKGALANPESLEYFRNII